MTAATKSPLATPQKINDFWLHEVGPEFWYKQSDEVDNRIRETYGALRDEAAKGALDDWMNTPEGALALMILLDQFSRNLYRGNAESFAADAKARQLARQAIDQGFDREFEPAMRQFFYMPFCHSEDIADHNWLLSVAEDAGLEKNMIDFHAHHDIIAKFGRFPYRNQALGRHSTEDEIEFMENGGYMTMRNHWAEKLGG